MGALTAEVIEGRIRYLSLPGTEVPTDEQTRAADDLVIALRAISNKAGAIWARVTFRR
jgi:hypothetical protein